MDTTVFIRFLAAWMRDMALSSYTGERIQVVLRMGKLNERRGYGV